MCSPYSAYIGVGSVVPTMIAAKAYAIRGKARRCAVTLKNSGRGLPPYSAETVFQQAASRTSAAGIPFRGCRESVGDGLLGADAGQGTHLELGVDLGIATVRRAQRADDAQDERQRDRYDA